MWQQGPPSTALCACDLEGDEGSDPALEGLQRGSGSDLLETRRAGGSCKESCVEIAPTGDAVHSAQTPTPLKTGPVRAVPSSPASPRAPTSCLACFLPRPQLKGSPPSTRRDRAEGQSEKPGREGGGAPGRCSEGLWEGWGGTRSAWGGVLLEVLSAE